MAEFDDFDLDDSVTETRKKRKQWERREVERARLDVERANQALMKTQERNRKRTGQLFRKLKALEARTLGDGSTLTVVMDSRIPTPKGLVPRPDGGEWAVVQAKSAGTKPNHRPAVPGQPEYVLALRCQTEPKYYLEIYPARRQDRPVQRVTDDPFKLREWILEEITTRGAE
jgi:hypothetical protein